MLVSGQPAGGTSVAVQRMPGRAPVPVEPDVRGTAPVNLRRMRCASARVRVYTSCVSDVEVAVQVGMPLSGVSAAGPAEEIGLFEVGRNINTGRTDWYLGEDEGFTL